MVVEVFLTKGGCLMNSFFVEHYTWLRSKMHHIKDLGLTSRRLMMFNYFDEQVIPAPKGKKPNPVSKTWLPHAFFILTNSA